MAADSGHGTGGEVPPDEVAVRRGCVRPPGRQVDRDGQGPAGELLVEVHPNDPVTVFVGYQLGRVTEEGDQAVESSFEDGYGDLSPRRNPVDDDGCPIEGDRGLCHGSLRGHDQPEKPAASAHCLSPTSGRCATCPHLRVSGHGQGGTRSVEADGRVARAGPEDRAAIVERQRP